MSGELSRAERALFQRAELAGRAATDAGVAGRFRAWRPDGLFAVLATDPGLRFLTTVWGVTPDTVAAVPAVLRSSEWDGVRPTVLAPVDFGDALSAKGLVAAGGSALATRPLDDVPAEPGGVIEAGAGFVDLLIDGYEVTGIVADYIRAEHRMPAGHRFHAVVDGAPIASAAMTVHDDVAVLGGASTPPAQRGRGAQTRLLAHRLRLAASLGCTLAVATARSGSVSEANLIRSGFRVHRRPAWQVAPTVG